MGTEAAPHEVVSSRSGMDPRGGRHLNQRPPDSHPMGTGVPQRGPVTVPTIVLGYLGPPARSAR